MRLHVRAPLLNHAPKLVYEDADNPLQAAEAYARGLFFDGDIDELSESIEVHVRDEVDNTWAFCVAIDWAPTFRARLKTGATP